MVLKFIWLKHVTSDHILLFLTHIRSANSSSSVAIFQIQSLVDLFSNLLGRSSEAPLLSFINMWCCIGKALDRESSKWRHVLRVAGHQEQLHQHVVLHRESTGQGELQMATCTQSSRSSGTASWGTGTRCSDTCRRSMTTEPKLKEHTNGRMTSATPTSYRTLLMRTVTGLLTATLFPPLSTVCLPTETRVHSSPPSPTKTTLWSPLNDSSKFHKKF